MFDPWVEKIPWRREWQPTPVFLPGEFHGQRSLVDYSPWCLKELEAEQLSLSLIHFEFIFVCGVSKCSSFILLHIDVQFSQHHLLKRLSFLHCIFLSPLSKIRCPYVHEFIFALSTLFHWSIFLFLCQYHTILMTVPL